MQQQQCSIWIGYSTARIPRTHTALTHTNAVKHATSALRRTGGGRTLFQDGRKYFIKMGKIFPSKTSARASHALVISFIDGYRYRDIAHTHLTTGCAIFIPNKQTNARKEEDAHTATSSHQAQTQPMHGLVRTGIIYRNGSIRVSRFSNRYNLHLIFPFQTPRNFGKSKIMCNLKTNSEKSSRYFVRCLGNVLLSDIEARDSGLNNEIGMWQCRQPQKGGGGAGLHFIFLVLFIFSLLLLLYYASTSY